MNNQFGRDNSYRNEGYRGEDYSREQERREPFWRGSEGDAERSPDQEFETSGNYSQPREPYGQTFSNRQYPYGSSGYGGPGQRGSAHGSSLQSRSRFDGNYAPSYGSSGWSSEVRGGHTGRGPKGYTRSDERIREDVCERLSWNDEVDATDIVVRVQDAEVTLEGSVETRHMKRLAEDLASAVPGARDIHNTVRVRKPMLTELKEKLTGEHPHEHFANTGTKSGISSRTSANGRA